MSSPEFWTASGLARACGGTLVGDPRDAVTGLSTDTRELEKGGRLAFLALRGERFDGHMFLDQAIKRGVRVLIVDQAFDTPNATVIRVPDTAQALVDLASAWRDRLTDTRIVGVTGSNGKTTTVRMIDAALRGKLPGRASIKSFNNIIGVPLTLLGTRRDDRYLVAEAGMNAPGEMAPLSRVLRPDIAVICSIGRAHIGAFADGVAGIAREKSALAAHLAGGGSIIATADSPDLRAVLAGDPRVTWVGLAPDATVRVTDYAPTPAGGGMFRVGGDKFGVPAPGVHNALNAAIAVTAARRFGLRDRDIRDGLWAFEPAPMRFQSQVIGDATIINDAYNANPESVLAALSSFALIRRDARRRIIVLGEMREMGDASVRVHREIGHEIARTEPDLLITVGPEARIAGVVAGVPRHHEDRLDDGGAERIASMFTGGDAVLMKGSRGVGLERILEAWRQRAGAPEGVGR